MMVFYSEPDPAKNHVRGTRMESGKLMRILVVDDEQLVRWFLERAMKKWGHDVVSVSNNREALNHLNASTFDVVFTDLRMPGGNGSDLIKVVREKSRNLKVVVCSAFITNDMAEEFRGKGIHILKNPLKLAELESTLKLCQP